MLSFESLNTFGLFKNKNLKKQKYYLKDINQKKNRTNSKVLIMEKIKKFLSSTKYQKI